MDTCLICFSAISEAPIRCGNPQCTAAMCSECAGFLLDYSLKEGGVPRCPSEHCKNVILLKNLKNFPEVMDRYYKVCFSELLRTKGDMAQKKVNAEVMIVKLREERRTFIRDHFPAAIALVAELAFKGQVQRLEKQKREQIEETLKKTHKTCMTLMCNGLLDDEYKCIKCLTEFCKKCERRFGAGHTCDENDVNSIAFIQNLVKCPKCGLAVEKSDGCNDMKCSNCGTNFNYRTGQAGGSGNNHNIGITTQNRLMLSVVYAEKLTRDLLNLLVQIENCAPHTGEPNVVTNYLKKHYKGEPVSGKEVTLAYHRWLEKSYKVKQYYNYIHEIENLIKREELQIVHLRKILGEINSL